MDLIVRNVHLRNSEEIVDIAIKDKKIAKIAANLSEKAHQEIDGEKGLAVPSFIDPHVHLDKALISEVVRKNVSGTLTEAIEIIWEKKRNYTIEDISQRAGKVIEWALSNGTTAMRTHVDVDTIGGLMPLKGVLEAKKKYAHIMNLQIVAFPQEGILQDPGTEKLMYEAMELGADIVGGMPYNEMTYDDSKRHIDIAFEIAHKFDADIDMHVDETDDFTAHTLQYLAAKTIKEKYFGKVTAGHTCALSAYNPYYAAKIISLVKKAQIHMITNPVTNLMLEGRLDLEAKRRGLTRVKEVTRSGSECGIWARLLERHLLSYIRQSRYVRSRADHRPRCSIIYA